ncbi:biotin/lipoyl-binding carrier protein [Quadrisphaera sp. DSM 44207]|uniref:biotin/lipoyl-binding carrier protein n=1 Tax=Quadrisphaera sp. DSM 44207 TaxID=1881057 RepID=UPI00087F79DD|nr:biotin/lipoyl-binding carrier protein [Quadrisphaera sp. DSM 44207]SDQ07829.1 Biotin-requiring enzyme [Quadrisphaera sp. DSM 44207]
MLPQDAPVPPGGEVVRAELVARVLEVAVAAGERVRAGQELVLLESMKMEIPVLPERGGTVLAVAVAPGDVVQAGDVLVVLDDAAPARDGGPQGGRRGAR